jgi:hypothetical protein
MRIRLLANAFGVHVAAWLVIVQGTLEALVPRDHRLLELLAATVVQVGREGVGWAVVIDSQVPRPRAALVAVVVFAFFEVELERGAQELAQPLGMNGFMTPNMLNTLLS